MMVQLAVFEDSKVHKVSSVEFPDDFFQENTWKEALKSKEIKDLLRGVFKELSTEDPMNSIIGSSDLILKLYNGLTEGQNCITSIVREKVGREESKLIITYTEG